MQEPWVNMARIYTYEEIRLSHKSIALTGGNKFEVIKKIFFQKNKDIAVLLQNGMSEFAMASMIDTYGRTFPASFKTYILNDTAIHTRYGLSLIHTGDNSIKGLDELNVMMPETLSETDESFFKEIKIIRYEKLQYQYLFDVYFNRIGEQYGHQFEKFVNRITHLGRICNVGVGLVSHKPHYQLMPNAF